MSKGSRNRVQDTETFGKNYEAIFGSSRSIDSIEVNRQQAADDIAAEEPAPIQSTTAEVTDK